MFRSNVNQETKPLAYKVMMPTYGGIHIFHPYGDYTIPAQGDF
jgi:hypothetical protein